MPGQRVINPDGRIQSTTTFKITLENEPGINRFVIENSAIFI